MSTPPAQTPSLTHRAARGAMLGSIAAVIDRLNALGIQAALTYILLKADFGIWSLASPIMGLATLLVQTAVRDILIHRSPKFHLWSNPAAWLSFTLGLIAALAVILLGIGASFAYDSPQLTIVLLIASIQPLASSITTVPRAKMSIDMRFGTIASYYCATSISNWTLALVFAFFGAGVYAFPIGIGITSIAQIIFIWSFAPVPLKRFPQIRRWKYIISDTGTIVASNFANWIRTQGDRLILGFFLSEAMMGIYFLAFQLSIQTFSVITLNLSSVLLPTLASLNNDPKRQADAFLRSLKMLLFLAAPICAGTIVVATPITNILFDESKWQHLNTTLQIITVGMIFRAIEPPVRSLMNAQGRFRELFHLNVLSTISFSIFIASILLASGLVHQEIAPLYAAAIAGVAFHIAWALVLIHAAFKNTNLTTTQAVLTLAQPLVYAILAALVAAALTLPLPPVHTATLDAARIAIAIAAFLLTYALIARIHRPAEFDVLIGFTIKAAPRPLRPLITRLARLVFNAAHA